MAQQVMHALGQMANTPHTVTTTNVTNILNQYGFAANPSMMDAAMRGARGRASASQLAWHLAALQGSPGGVAMAQGMAALPAPEHHLSIMDVNMAPASMDAASSAPLAICGPEGNVLSIEDGVAMVPPPPPRPVSPPPGVRKEPLAVHRDTAEVAAKVINGQLSLTDGQEALRGRGANRSPARSPPRAMSDEPVYHRGTSQDEAPLVALPVRRHPPPRSLVRRQNSPPRSGPYDRSRFRGPEKKKKFDDDEMDL